MKWTEPRHKVTCLNTASLVQATAAGNGIDRHLYALYCIWQQGAEAGEPPPPLFADIGWKALNHTCLSTSNCGNPVLRLFGFGPVVEDGFGIGYIIKDGSISFCASSKHRQTRRFLARLADTLQGMHALLDEADRQLTQRRLEMQAEESGAYYQFFEAGSSELPAAPSLPGGDRIQQPRIGRRVHRGRGRGAVAGRPRGGRGTQRGRRGRRGDRGWPRG